MSRANVENQEVYQPALPMRYRWTRRQYEHMIETGVLGEDDRVELIEGEILAMAPQKSRHAAAVMLLVDALTRAYSDEYMVRPQLPIALDPDSEPEPDVAIVPGRPRDYLGGHPASAILVVEVADTTLKQDRTQKARLYARHRIPEYWILNLVDECLEVYRDPDRSAETYQTKITLHRGDTVTPPQATRSVTVTDVLP